MRKICLSLLVAIFLFAPLSFSYGALPGDSKVTVPSSTAKLDLNRVAQNQIIPEMTGESSGMDQPILAEFLQRMAVVVATGDRKQIEEFADKLMTPYFYKNYGLSWMSSKASEIAYSHYLEQYVKPRSVNAMMKTSIVIATGKALPMIIEGNFKGKTFAISAASLGLSTAVVKSGVKGIEWFNDLHKARKTSTLSRIGVKAGRLAKTGSVCYFVAEQAVILYVEDEVRKRLTAYFTLKEELNSQAVAVKELFDAINNPDANEVSLGTAVDTYHDGWTRYRNFLYYPLELEEDKLMERLEKVAEDAKLQNDIDKDIIRVKSHPALLESILNRYSSLEEYVEKSFHKDRMKITKDVSDLFRDYSGKCEILLQKIYTDNRRDSILLDDVVDFNGLIAGARIGAEDDPGKINTVLSVLERAVKNSSRNRLQTYDDEAEIFAVLESWLRASGREDLAKILLRKLEIVKSIKQADGNLIKSNGLVDTSDL